VKKLNDCDVGYWFPPDSISLPTLRLIAFLALELHPQLHQFPA